MKKINNKLLKKLVVAIVLGGMVFMAGLFFTNYHASAYQIGDINLNPDVPYEAGQEGVRKIFETVFNAVIMVSNIVFIVMLLIGGVMYLNSAGSEESAKNARKTMINAMIGLVIVLASWGVGTWVLRILQR